MEMGFWGSALKLCVGRQEQVTAQVTVPWLGAENCSKLSPEQRSHVKCIFSCYWRPGKIPGVWGIVAEMFHA